MERSVSTDHVDVRQQHAENGHSRFMRRSSGSRASRSSARKPAIADQSHTAGQGDARLTQKSSRESPQSSIRREVCAKRDASRY